MQAIVETLFDAVYLVSVITIGFSAGWRCCWAREIRSI